MIVAVTLLMLTLQESFLRKQYHVEREAQIGEVLHTEKSHVKQTINTLRQDVLFLSNTPPVSGIIRAHENKGYDARDKNPLERWERRLQEIFTAFSRAHPDYYRIRYVGVADGGRELVRMDNRDGKVGVTAPHLLRPLANEAFFRSAQKLLPGQIGLSKFELDRDSGTSAANFSFGLHAVTPVYSDNGKLFGMMILTLDARAILQSAMHGLPGGAKTLIADESGHYLMRQEVNGGTVFSENEAGLITAEIPELSALFDRDTDDYFPLSPIRSTVGDQYVAAERVHFDPLDPERFLLIAYSMPGNGRGGLATSWQTLLVALFGMLAVGGILSAMLKRAFAPLESLAQRASEMAAGNCALHMPPASGEIGHLSSALNVMLDQLSLRENQILRTNEALEQRVEERTRELSGSNERLQLEMESRERVENILRGQNQFKQALIESLPGVFYMLGSDGRFLMWNKNLEGVLHCNAAELAHHDPLDFFEGEDRILIERSIRKVFESGETSVDAVLVAQDGTRTPYHFTGRRIERDGVPVLVGLGMDISDRQRILRETEALLRRNQALMSSSMEGIHVMDMQGNVVDANASFCSMLGYTRDEVLRLNVADWDAQWSEEELRERFRALLGNSAMFETVHKRKDGSLVQVEICTTGVELDGAGYLFAASRDITERKRAEEVMQRYRQVIETTADGFWLTDMQGRLLDANEAYAKMSGYTVGELTRLHIRDLEAKEHSEETRAHIEKLMAEGYDRFETRHRHKDGHEIDIEVSTTYMAEQQQLFVFSRDISERKQAAAVLERYKLVIDAAMDGFWVTDLKGILLEVNESYARMTGYEAEELVGMHISQLEALEQAEDVREHIQKIMAQGYDQFETRHRRKDGSEIDIEISVNYLASRQQLFVFCRDISERKQTSEALRIAAVAFETHEAILITDAKANILRVNQAFTDITGYTLDEVLGRNPSFMSSGRHDKQFYVSMWQQLLNTGSWAGEIWDKRKSGQVYPKWMTISAVKNERRETTQYVAIFSDITARKQAEDEIRNLAFYDSLTKLPNRRLFLDRFRASLPASVRHNTFGALLFIDLDRFKILNDTLGHEYGDLMLIEVAARIKSCVREVDTAARLGGDEFVVLVEEVGAESEEAKCKALLVAEKIREALAQPYALKEHEHQSSPSIGITLYRGNEIAVEELLKQADTAMYQAKKDGRNAVRIYTA